MPELEQTERDRWIAVEVLGGKRLVRDHGTYIVWSVDDIDDGLYQYATTPPPGFEYIGDQSDAAAFAELGIVRERRRGSKPGSTCCVGFCAREQRWHGWSHRARRSYGVGDEAFLVQWTQDEDGQGFAPIPPGHGVKIQTLEDARHSAERFAEDVS